MKPACCLIVAAALLCTTGCSVSTTPTTASAGVSLSGNVHGGQQPVSGATIQLYAVSSGGYGTASIPLISSPGVTDGGGGFTLPSYNCPTPATTPVYLVATGGNPGLSGNVNNTALSLMAALGPCNKLTPTTFLTINELTTVAAAWSLAPFSTGYTSIGSSSSNTIGLANAFATSANLVSSFIGQTVNTTLPASATAPVAELDTLANILASCVNTSGGTAGDTTPCGKLFTAATPSGGTAPTDTATAAVNIAQHPGVNVATLYNLTTSTGAFQPTLTAAPNDWTVAINYAGTKATSLALDAAGDIWISSATGLVELSPAGALLSPAAGYSYNGASSGQLAIDPAGNIWVAGKQLSQFTQNGSANSPSGGYPAYSYLSTAALAIDGSNNVWALPSNSSTLLELSSAGASTASYTLTSVFHPTTLTIDGTNSLWAGNADNSFVSRILKSGSTYTVTKYTSNASTGVAADASNNVWIGGQSLGKVTAAGVYTSVASYPTGGISTPQFTAIDGGGNIWVTNSNSVSNQPGALSEFSSAGTAITPTTGYLSSTFAAPTSTALDGSGNAWSFNSTNGSITELVGVAAPTVTPLSLAVKNATIGSKP